MPIYNGAERVGQALAALSKQSYRDFRVIISDNASTDNTWSILQEWAARDVRILLHRQAVNIGASRNYQYLLDQAETDYFMWHAHDDHLAPNYLEELVEALNGDPESSLACGVGVHERPDGSMVRRVQAPQMASKSQLTRIRNMLKKPEITWFYGLYRTVDLRQARLMANELGTLWSADQLMVLHFILNDSIRGCSNTTFYRCRTTRSKESYRPKTVVAKMRFAIRYLHLHLRVLVFSNLSRRQKFLCLPWVLRHANRTLESFLQRPLKKFVRGMVKRLTQTGLARVFRKKA